jgi:hypothetical protein
MKSFVLEFFIAARFANLAVSLPQYQFASHKFAIIGLTKVVSWWSSSLANQFGDSQHLRSPIQRIEYKKNEAGRT